MHAQGHSPTAPTGYEELDKKLFYKLYGLLGKSDGMLHFQNHDYGNSYPRWHEEKLSDFMYIAGLPEAEFFDAQIANAFADLSAAIRDYKRLAQARIWSLSKEESGIPPEWSHGPNPSEERFSEAVDVMNKAATTVWDAFAQFVKAARASLKIEP